jgi:DNA primase
MSELAMHQSPDHVAQKGQTVMVDGDPFTVTAIKPQREKGVFLDYNQVVEYNEVVLTVERFDGNPA